MKRPTVELADAIRRYGDAFIARHPPPARHKNVLRAIAACRTSELGGHTDRCDNCGHIRVSYNSCRNRHCPKCQQVNKERWIMAREQDLLPVGYFHVVFTLPDTLNPLCLRHPKALYDLLFRTARDTLFAFAADPRHLGAETGFTAVLHTWGQTLALHPHLHCIIPAGGITVKGGWKNAPGEGSYLFPVKALSKVFRAKFRDGLKATAPKAGFEVTKELLARMFRSNWVVYAKEPFAGPEQVIEYLGRYTHRVAIGNHRLVSVDGVKIAFRYKDYRDGGKQKLMALDGVEFLRRFCLHILPYRFVKVRHYGFLSARRKGTELPALLRGEAAQIATQGPKPRLTWKQVCRQRLDFDPDTCPCCNQGRMVTIEVLLPRAPPAIPLAPSAPKQAAAI
jgi:hypothetical protein